jgi:hypothetical protein
VGELRPHDPEVAARTLLYTVQMLHMTGVPVDGFVPEMVEILLVGGSKLTRNVHLVQNSE